MSAITKGGSSEFHGTVYDYLRSYKFAANDRSNSIAGRPEAQEQVPVPGRQPQRPHPHSRAPASTRTATRPSSSSASSVTQQDVDTGSHFAVVPDRRPAQGQLQRLLGGGSEPEPAARPVQHPERLPRRGHCRPRQQPGPLHRPHGPDADEPLSRSPTATTPGQPLQLRVQRAPAAELQPVHPAPRLQLLRQHQGLRAPRPGQREKASRRAACGGTSSNYELPRPPSTTSTRAGRPR